MLAEIIWLLTWPVLILISYLLIRKAIKIYKLKVEDQQTDPE